MLDELRQIAIFAKTIEHGTFRAAAEELRLSPSVISHHIAQLEEKLGVALIYRSTRRMTLTQEGARLLSSATVMLDAVEAGLDDLRGQARDPVGELRVTLPSVLSQSRLIGDIAAFRLRYPRVNIHLDFTDERRDMIRDGYDLAIRMGPHRKRAPNRRTLFMTKRCLVAARSYLSGREPLRRPADLGGCDWVELAPARGIRTVLKKPGQTAVQITPQAGIVANDATAVYRLAQAGAGVGIVPDFLIDRDRVMVLFPDWTLDPLGTYAEWPGNLPSNSPARLLVDEMSRVVGVDEA